MRGLLFPTHHSPLSNHERERFFMAQPSRVFIVVRNRYCVARAGAGHSPPLSWHAGKPKPETVVSFCSKSSFHASPVAGCHICPQVNRMHHSVHSRGASWTAQQPSSERSRSVAYSRFCFSLPLVRPQRPQPTTLRKTSASITHHYRNQYQQPN